MRYFRKLFVISLIIVWICLGNKVIDASEPSKEALWKKIEKYFTPPPKYAHDFGDYRTQLHYYDGRSVKSPEEWPERRKEILDTWTEFMGEWPPLIKNQKLEILEETHRENFTQYKVSFYWLPNEKTTGYLLVPDGEGKHPAVINVYYDPETAIGMGRKYRDFAYQLTKRGFVTLSIGTTESTKAQTYSLYYPSLENAEVQPLSMLAYSAANTWYVLANWPEVDSERIGIVGHSFGGKWAMFASCLFDKFACAVWSDAGIVFDESQADVNYWEPWYLGYDKPPWRKRGIITQENPARGVYPRLVDEGHDLHELHALMAPRPFLVSGGRVDRPLRWKALNSTIALYKFLGYENRISMTNRLRHAPNWKSNEQIYLFFEYFLK